MRFPNFTIWSLCHPQKKLFSLLTLRSILALQEKLLGYGTVLGFWVDFPFSAAQVDLLPKPFLGHG